MAYLQVDLILIHTVTYIATQGSLKKYSWVTSYYLEYSGDGRQWNEYKEADGNRRVREIYWINISIWATANLPLP